MLHITRTLGESLSVHDTTGTAGPLKITLLPRVYKGERRANEVLLHIDGPRSIVVLRDDVVRSHGTHGGEPHGLDTIEKPL